MIFRSRQPCASVRDRLTTSDCSDFWHTSDLLPFGGHCGSRDQLCGRMPPPVFNSLFSGPQTACFGHRTSDLHSFWFIFCGDLIFIVRKVVGGWKARNFSEKPVLFLHRSPSPVFLTKKLILTTRGPLSLALNPIFVLYTPGRPPICIGRPVIVLAPFDPWAATNIWWPTSNCHCPF